ncbi:LysM peptidoglycan-binding and 3D domain-containing protein [Heyndrickxia acidicola]|uniref:LysM peptidoglycan-binding domain-containing protein n=1 Tax=Heyndrickxia acidicola TaxID=209389 RepID=A0ABU6MDK8_9BACI|nr:3D domain-containing protein [Heyndrickxia acidicola]MED1202752.1 LysM peptidoglycan-binding domain-containing protein [Heyndrickxia acidicola]
MLKKIIMIIAVAVLSGTVSANVQAATITVKRGDTLWGLSRLHKTTVKNIKEWNHLNTDLIHPGRSLTISPNSLHQQKQYTVKHGDTLWGIARNYHVSVSELMKWNKLTSDLIHPGLNLDIFGGLTTAQYTMNKDTNAPTASATKVEAASTTIPSSRVVTVKATAYTASCAGCSGTTATGINIKANPNEKVIAVDPSVIPLGSKVYVPGYGEATAADTGGAIKGNRIDVFIPTEQAALNFGVKHVNVTILN